MVGNNSKHIVPIKSKANLSEYFKLKNIDRTMAIVDTATRRELAMDGVSHILVHGIPRKIETVSLGGGLWEVKLGAKRHS